MKSEQCRTILFWRTSLNHSPNSTMLTSASDFVWLYPSCVP